MKKTMKCRACGGEISPGVKVCPFCGKKRKKPLVVRIFMWILLLSFFGIAAGIMQGISSGDNPERKSTSTLGKAMELTQEQEEKVLDIFARCGIGEVYSAEVFQMGEQETSYHVEDSETKAYGGIDYTIVVWLANESKEVQAIYFHEQDIYKDGEALAKVSDFYVNEEERGQYRVSAQLLINQLLLVPDSANYPAASGWAFQLEDDKVTVQSSVKSQNAFGVTLENKFQIIFRGGNPISVILDGKEYLK